jgi:hypothetical protein
MIVSGMQLTHTIRPKMPEFIVPISENWQIDQNNISIKLFDIKTLQVFMCFYLSMPLNNPKTPEFTYYS